MGTAMFVLLLFLTGILLPILVGVTSPLALVWSGIPYAIYAAVFFFRKDASIIYLCLALMLIIDAVFYGSMRFNLAENYLMLLSLLSTLKIFIPLPIIIFQWLVGKNGNFTH